MIPVSYSHRTYANTPQPSVFWRLGAFSTRFLGLLILAFVALLYIAQSSQGATKRIEQQTLRSKVDTLVQEQDQLRLDLVRQQATLDSISQSTTDMELEPVNSVEFLSPAN